MPIFNSNSAEKMDPFYPKEWSSSGTLETEKVDSCTGHPQVNGLYHYHILPPCLVAKDHIIATDPCAKNSACSNDIATYTKGYYTTYAKTYTVLGIAKDGHKIIGPYDSTGNEIDTATLD